MAIAMNAQTPVYHLRDVVKVRSKGGVQFILKVPELKIYPGQFWAVVGPSGCGKSTLLDMLALVLGPTSVDQFTICPNTREHQGKEVNLLSQNDAASIRKRAIGYVLQNGGLLPFLSVRENILITAELSGKILSSDELETLVDALGLQDQLDKKPQYLSGGQRQRVAVARALIHRPAIVLADEPTAAVDQATARDVRDELKMLAHKAGSAVVLVTHDRALTEGVTDAQVTFNVTRTSSHETEAVATVIS